MSNLEPCGHRVLIKPHLQEETSEGGIFLAVGNTFERELGATQIGTIVAVGTSAWLDFKPGKPWAKVGDKVYYAKYAGKDVIAGNEEKLVIINDEDVQAIIHDEDK